jgi:hypothetical protein
MSKLVTKEHSYADILKGSMAQAQNKNQKNPTRAKKYFGELEDIRLLTKIFHSRPPFLFTVTV